MDPGPSQVTVVTVRQSAGPRTAPCAGWLTFADGAPSGIAGVLETEDAFGTERIGDAPSGLGRVGKSVAPYAAGVLGQYRFPEIVVGICGKARAIFVRDAGDQMPEPSTRRRYKNILSLHCSNFLIITNRK